MAGIINTEPELSIGLPTTPPSRGDDVRTQVGFSETKPTISNSAPGIAEKSPALQKKDNSFFSGRAQETPVAPTAKAPPNTDARGSITPSQPVSTYTPERISLGEEDTVQGRIPGIINASGELGELQTTRAKQAQNRKGTLNTTMSQQAESTALYDLAVPIAQADAATSFASKGLNQEAANRASEFSAASRNQFGLSRQEGEIQSRLLKERGDIDIQMQNADIETKKELQRRQGEIDSELTSLKGDITSRQMGEEFGFQTSGRTQQGEIQSRLLKERGDIDLQLQTADAATREKLLNRKAEIDTEMAGQRAEIESRLLEERGDIDLQLQTADAADREKLLNRKAEIDTEMASLQATLQKDIAAQQQEFKLARDKVLSDFQSAENEIERQFQGDQNAEQRTLAREELLRNAASELMRQVSGQNATFMDAVGEIQSSDMLWSAKTRLIESMSKIHLNNLQTTSAMSDFDIVDGKVVYNPGAGGGYTGGSGGAAGTPGNQTPASPSNYPYSPGEIAAGTPGSPGGQIPAHESTPQEWDWGGGWKY